MRRQRSAQPSAFLPTAHPTALVAVLSAAGIGVALMQTLLVPLIPELPNLLHTSASNASWAVTATLLTAAVATPVFGRLGDMYGPQPMLITCAVMVIAGSLMAAATNTLAPLIIGRGLQGFGIPIIPLGISVLRSCVSAERVGSAMGLMSASLGVGGALGLPLSAVIAQHFDWRVLFWFATAIGVAALVMFVTMVPDVPPRSADRLDPLGALLLAGGLVALLLGISKGQSWGWTSTLTLWMFGSSALIFAVFGWWELRVTSPTVDLRTTVKRPVLMTNMASIAIAFGMFAVSYVAPQLLELPVETGYGHGQSLLSTGLWLAPGGLAMVVTSPIAARISAVRGPRFTLVVGALMICGAYLAGPVLLAAPWQLMVLNIMVAAGVGFGYASMPALINAAVPMSETAAANGINALARSLGTAISSAVIGAILAGLTMSFQGHEVPTLAGLRMALMVAAGAAGLAALLALFIPRVPRTAVAEAAASPPSDDLALPTSWLERSAFLLCDHIDESGDVTLRQLAEQFQIDVPTAGRHVCALLRQGLATGADRDGSLSFWLTQRGRERLYQERVHGRLNLPS